MYNANYPKDNELPSSKQLLISTFGAFVVASILLLTTILPAEYGIDPTGLGKVLGLTQMGEIKLQLAEEAAQEDTASIIKAEATAMKVEPGMAHIVKPKEDVVSQPELASDSIKITLKKGEAAEVKVAMKKDQIVSYQWTVNTGHLNFDNHGDNPSTKYHNYSKGKAVTNDEGEIKAAFDGKHGWFWRNRSEQTVTVILNITGDYSSFERVL